MNYEDFNFNNYEAPESENLSEENNKEKRRVAVRINKNKDFKKDPYAPE